MSSYQEKLQGIPKGRKYNLKRPGKALESDMAGMLELSDWEFKTTLIRMLRAIMWHGHIYTTKCKIDS